MQLRVARLCLDCEELHTGDSCPRCASHSFAFLTTWLPVDERRRWNRPARSAAHAERGWAAFVGVVGRWLRGEPGEARTAAEPATRQSDMVAQLQLHFDEPAAAVDRGTRRARPAAPIVRG